VNFTRLRVDDLDALAAVVEKELVARLVCLSQRGLELLSPLAVVDAELGVAVALRVSRAI
jgi:hypothetical protein